MLQQKIKITSIGPILPGSVYPSLIKCGKKNCRCYNDSSKRHIIYQWSGNIDGKNSSKGLTKKMYLECKKRIANYKKFQAKIKNTIDRSLNNAPWNE